MSQHIIIKCYLSITVWVIEKKNCSASSLGMARVIQKFCRTTLHSHSDISVVASVSRTASCALHAHKSSCDGNFDKMPQGGAVGGLPNGVRHLSCSKKTDVTFQWVPQNEPLHSKWLCTMPLHQRRRANVLVGSLMTSRVTSFNGRYCCCGSR